MEVERPPLSLINRAHRFLEYGSFQTLLGIIGGFVGTFLDGRYFVLLGGWITWALHRSGALQGLERRKALLAHALVLISGVTALLILGEAVNKRKTHVYTPSDYAAAFKEGRPPPIVQQFFPTKQEFVTKTIERSSPVHSHVVFIAPTFVQEPGLSDVPHVNIVYVNQGPSIVFRSLMRARIVYGQRKGGKCDTREFDTFKTAADFSLVGPMLGIGEPKYHTFEPENAPTGKGGLYLSASVQWTDESGRYETSYFEYFDSEDKNWHTCGVNNSEQKLK